MTSILTNEDKIAILNQHIKNLAYSLYNVEVSKIEANAATTPNASTVSSLTAQAAELTAQIDALQEELDSF